MGSVIKLLTPSSRDYSDGYNRWLEGIPQHIKENSSSWSKRFHRTEWGDDWRKHYSVDVINGRLGYSLKLDGSKLIVNTLRVGFEKDGAWRVFGLRHDFHPAVVRSQTEDDITASVVAPGEPGTAGPAAGLWEVVQNPASALFQRPDDAIHRRTTGRPRPTSPRREPSCPTSSR